MTVARKHLLVVGSSNTDMVVKSRHLPRPGETETGGEFLMAAGGKGANQAVAAARLGADVVFAAKVGADLFGEEAIAGYQREGIDTGLIVREADYATGVALILVGGDGENMISVASGANFHWTDEDIARIRPTLEKASILVMQLEIPLKTVCAFAQAACELGVPVLLDPAPAPAGDFPDELLRNISYLKPNEHEAERLSGVTIVDRASAVRAAETLLARGVRDSVVITLGEQGSLVLKRDAEPVFLRPRKIEAVDTTAAGDAFTGALAFQLSSGSDLVEAVDFSNQVAARSAMRLGAQPSLPTWSEVTDFIKERDPS